MYIPKFLLVVALVGMGALILNWFQLRRKHRFGAAERMILHIRNCLPRMSVADVETICTLPHQQLFQIIDCFDAVVDPRPIPGVKSEISETMLQSMRDEFEMIFATELQITPRVAHTLSRYSKDEMKVARDGLLPLYSAKARNQ